MSQTEWEGPGFCASESDVDDNTKLSGSETTSLSESCLPDSTSLEECQFLTFDVEMEAWTLRQIDCQNDARNVLSTVMVNVLNGKIGKPDGNFLVKALTLMVKSLTVSVDQQKTDINDTLGEQLEEYQTDEEIAELEAFARLPEGVPVNG